MSATLSNLTAAELIEWAEWLENDAAFLEKSAQDYKGRPGEWYAKLSGTVADNAKHSAGLAAEARRAAALIEYFPAKDWMIAEEIDAERAKDLRQSRTACCWGQGPIGETGYFQLARPSPQSAGDKRIVVVCKTALLEEAAA